MVGMMGTTKAQGKANRGSGYSFIKRSCLCILLLSLSVFPVVDAIIESTELRRAAAGIAAGLPLYQDDRLLFWSSYEFNIDAALQQLGPLADLLYLRGGGDEDDDDKEEKERAATATLLRPDEEDDQQEQQQRHTHVRGRSRTTIISTSSNITTTSSMQHHATTAVNVSEQEGLSHVTPVAQLSKSPILIDNDMVTARDAERVNYTLFQDGDGSADDPDGIPTRFILMHNGDRAAAQTSLNAALQWRDEHQIDDILNQPQTKFDICKTIFPHFFLGRDLPGQHVVFVQRPARLDLERGLKNNLTPDDLLFHYVFVNEYLWQVVERDSPLATMISIIDLQGLHLGVLRKPDIISFVKRFVTTMDSYYPQRAHQTLLLNAPRWFSTLYKLISPLLRETTKAKIQILTRSKHQDEALQAVLGPDAIPAVPASFWSSWKPLKKRRRRNHNKNNKRRRKQQQEEKQGDQDDDDDNNNTEDDEEDEQEQYVPPSDGMEAELREFVLARIRAAGQEMQTVV